MRKGRVIQIITTILCIAVTVLALALFKGAIAPTPDTLEMKFNAAHKKAASFAKDDLSEAARTARHELEIARRQLLPMVMKSYSPSSKSDPSSHGFGVMHVGVFLFLIGMCFKPTRKALALLLLFLFVIFSSGLPRSGK